MKKIFFILTVLCGVLSHSLTALAAGCGNIRPHPQIEFSTSYGQLRYDFRNDNQQITQIAKKYGIIEKGLFASGLATVNVSWEISLNTLGQIIGDYDICVIPTHINIFIGYSEPVIYISNELEKNSCEYNVVLRHEQTHQQINKTALDYFLPQLQKQIQAIASGIKPLNVYSITDIDKATIDLTKNYNEKIAPYIDDFKNKLLAEQSKLDNHLNYEHESKLCKP